MKYKIFTLGCKVNEYESEAMGFLLENHGYVKDDNPNVVIVNTCTVTNNADSKSRKLIRRVRKEFPDAILVVCGCMIQNTKDKNIDADIIIGNVGKCEIINYLNDYKNKKTYNVKDVFKSKFENVSLSSFNRVRAYIKIQDGCDNYCSFCIIPFVRGHVRCKRVNDVLNEVKNLVDSGHKEIVLTGIHTGNYHDGDVKFSDLLEKIVKIKKLKRLRISSIEITEIDSRVLDVIQKNDVLVDHMHIPLQSGSDDVLLAMNRKYDKDYFEKKIDEIRRIRPDMSITTDVIVGFPGETSENFDESMKFIKNINFSKVHVFPYSDREGTKASKMEGKVSAFEKKERVKKLIDLSRRLEMNYMENHLNSVVSFIPEVYKDGFLIGHTGNYLNIKACGDKKLIGKEVDVKINSISYPYLISEIIDF